MKHNHHFITHVCAQKYQELRTFNNDMIKHITYAALKKESK